jgi:hypothetical protein
MCLSAVTKTYKKNNNSGFGWKIIKIRDDGFVSPCYGSAQKFDKWLNSNTIMIEANNGQCYKSGFHVFKTRQAARDHWLWKVRNGVVTRKIVKVQYKNIICEGIDKGVKTIVAKQIFVPNP